MSNANACSTLGTNPSFSSLCLKNAAIAGLSCAGASFNAMTGASPALGARVGSPRLAAPRWRLARILVLVLVTVSPPSLTLPPQGGGEEQPYTRADLVSPVRRAECV